MSQAQVVVQWSPAAQTRLLPSSSSSLLSILLAPSLTDHFITTTAGLKTSSRCPGCGVVLLLAAAPPPHSDKSVLTLLLTETTQVTITHCVALTTAYTSTSRLQALPTRTVHESRQSHQAVRGLINLILHY